MLNVFQGAATLSLDAAGRLFLPATVSGQLTLTRHPQGCVMVFPRHEWEKFRERLVKLPMSAQWWKRIFLGSALDVAVDTEGGLVIPSGLRVAAGLNTHVSLLGMGSHFELWDVSTYLAHEAQALREGVPDAFSHFSF